MKKTQVMLTHNLSIRENLRTGEIGVKTHLQEREEDKNKPTQGAFLAMALGYKMQQPEFIESLYKEYRKYLNQVDDLVTGRKTKEELLEEDKTVH